MRNRLKTVPRPSDKLRQWVRPRTVTTPEPDNEKVVIYDFKEMELRVQGCEPLRV